MNIISQYKNLPKEVYIIFISKIINSSGNFIIPLITLIMTIKLKMPYELIELVISGIGVIGIVCGYLGGKISYFNKKNIYINSKYVLFYLYNLWIN